MLQVKRQRENEEDVNSKTRRLNPLYRLVVLEDEAPYEDDSRSDSSCSLQGKETDLVKDTTDATSHDDSNDSGDYFRPYLGATSGEMEVASSSDSFDALGEDLDENRDRRELSTSSGDNDFLGKVATIICMEDLGLLADTSNGVGSSDCSLDTEVPRADFWTCTQCKSKNNNPRFRYCEKCFKVRKSFNGDRPRCKRKKRPEPITFIRTFEASDSSSMDSDEEVPVKNPSVLVRPRKVSVGLRGDCVTRIESGNRVKASSISPTSGFQGIFVASSQETIAPSSSQETTIAASSQETTIAASSQDTSSSRGTSTQGSSKEIEDIVSKELGENCHVCLMRPNNGVFVHGNTGHSGFSCYKCAKIIKRRQNRCPLCNRKLSLVIKVINS